MSCWLLPVSRLGCGGYFEAPTHLIVVAHRTASDLVEIEPSPAATALRAQLRVSHAMIVRPVGARVVVGATCADTLLPTAIAPSRITSLAATARTALPSFCHPYTGRPRRQHSG